MRFNEDFIHRVREANDILGVIGEYVQLSRAGSSFRGLCPFPGHLEKTPSFFVNDIKQLYHCFGCQKGGDVYRFLMEFRGMSFYEAVEYLADKAHIPIPRPDPGKNVPANASKEGDDARKTMYRLNQYVATHYQHILKNLDPSSAVKTYMQKRGLNDEVVETFKLGYASEGWHDLVGFLKRGKAPLGMAETLGLIKRKQNQEYFDLFRDRLMFPIMTPQGHVIGFGGRSLGEQQPKYLNSPETPVFSKGKNLYGLHATAKFIRASDTAFVVEGYMDLIALYRFGIKNVVATLGTALTAHHARLLKKLCSQVVALFDGDDAGISASDKSLPVFLEAGLNAKCLILPDQLDPDEYLTERGVESFQSLVQSAPDHFLSFLSRQLKNYRGQPSEKVAVLDAVKEPLARTQDLRLKELYIRELADRLEVDRNWVLKALPRPNAEAIEMTGKSSPKAIDVPKEEMLILELMLKKAPFLEAVREAQAVELFEAPEVRQLALKVLEKYCQNPNDFDRLTTYLLNEDIQTNLLTKAALGAALAGLDEDKLGQLLQDCLKRVKDRHLKRESRKVLRALKSETDLSFENLEAFMKIAKESKGSGELDP